MPSIAIDVWLASILPILPPLALRKVRPTDELPVSRRIPMEDILSNITPEVEGRVWRERKCCLEAIMLLSESTEYDDGNALVSRPIRQHSYSAPARSDGTAFNELTKLPINNFLFFKFTPLRYTHFNEIFLFNKNLLLLLYNCIVQKFFSKPPVYCRKLPSPRFLLMDNHVLSGSVPLILSSEWNSIFTGLHRMILFSS